LAKISAYDPTFRNPSDSIILAWASALTLANIPRDVALDAVDRLYLQVDNPNFKPLPGALVAQSRVIMREKFDDRQERKAREQDLQGPERITLREWERRHGQKFPSFKGIGKSIPGEDDDVNPLLVSCDHCKATVGSPCVIPGTRALLTKTRAHDSRMAKAKGVPGG